MRPHLKALAGGMPPDTPGRYGDRLLTARQVAEWLGISTETVLRWARDGDIPSFRLRGRALRFSERELTAWLEQSRRS